MNRFALIAKSVSRQMGLEGGCPVASTQARPRLGFRTNGCFRVISLALALAAGAELVMAPAPRVAPISYVFSPAALAVLDGDKQRISGPFTFDAGTTTQSLVILTLTGASPLSGTYSVIPELMQFDAKTIEAKDMDGNYFVMA